MAQEGSQQPLSDDQMRRTWALVDILTLLKMRRNHPPPTVELIRRKYDALSLPALDTLSIMVDSAIAEKHRRLSPRQICGMVQAIRVFQEDTASEVAHVHACNNVVSATAVKRASCVAGHELRIGLQHLAEARKRGIPLSPIPTDLHAHAMNAVADSESTALKILGIGDAAVQESGSFASSTGLLTGTAFCIAILDRLHLRTDICCGSCHRIVSADELSICRRCGDHLACKECLGHATHASECGRVRSSVRSMAHSIMPHIRESARRVAVVQLSSSGLMVPMVTTSITAPLIPSSLYESLSRCSVVNPQDLHVYWRLLISFLANQEGDEQEAIEYERVHGLEAAEEAVVEHQPNASSKGSKLLPSERRRLRKKLRAAENRAKEEVRATEEAAAVAEADAVLERQSARSDATSSMLTSVLLKRGSIASPEVVTRTRAKRDSLKVAEMRARKPAKAKPEEPNTTEQKRINRDLTDACIVAAAILLQRRARAWLRCRKKLHRKVRSRAAKRIQSSVRTWLLRAVAAASITVTAGSNGCEGTDGEEHESVEPEPPKPASTEPATAECAICLDDDAEYAVVPCGHRCLCFNCSKAVSECPVCRGAMTAVLRVFV